MKNSARQNVDERHDYDSVRLAPLAMLRPDSYFTREFSQVPPAANEKKAPIIPPAMLQSKARSSARVRQAE